MRSTTSYIFTQKRLGIVASTLGEYAAKYIVARGDSLSQCYAGTLVRRAEMLQEFSGKRDIKAACTEENLSRFVKEFLCDGERSAFTVKSYRADLMTLWRAAADDELVPYPRSARVIGLKMPPLIVDCYRVHEVEAIIASAEEFRGIYDTGAPRALYWRAIVQFAFETGLRRGDCFLFDQSTLRQDGSFRLVQNKTRKVVQRRIRPSTVELLKRIGLQRPFEFPHGGWTFGTHFKMLVDFSGVKRGTFKWLRRAAGSYAEAERPGAGSKALGHSDPTMFTKHYDAGLDCVNIPMSPELSAEPERIAGQSPDLPMRTGARGPGRKAIAARVIRIRKSGRAG